LVANVYNYRLKDLIAAVPVSDAVQQFQNVARASATGFGVEASGQLTSRIKADASFAVQRSGDDTSALLRVNSPARLGKLIVERPLFGDRIFVSGGFQYMSERTTLAGYSVPAVYLVNLTAASRRLGNGLELQFGLRNLFNYRYWDPAGVQQEMDRIQQDGRSFFVRLSWAPERKADEATRTGTPGPAGQEP
jgi:iron complex outermembrane receptor protein